MAAQIRQLFGRQLSHIDSSMKTRPTDGLSNAPIMLKTSIYRSRTPITAMNSPRKISISTLVGLGQNAFIMYVFSSPPS